MLLSQSLIIKYLLIKIEKQDWESAVMVFVYLSKLCKNEKFNLPMNTFPKPPPPPEIEIMIVLINRGKEEKDKQSLWF